MNKRLLVLLLTLLMALGLTACGNDVKTIDNTKVGSATATAKETVSGYVFTFEGVTLSMNQDFSEVYESLGKEQTYFEAPSCAFEGIDKVYTYNHFEIDTYPDGDVDRISYIFLLDDIAATPEGASIGMTKDEIVALYGSASEETETSLIYSKDGMSLSFILTDNAVSSIQYSANVL